MLKMRLDNYVVNDFSSKIGHFGLKEDKVLAK